MTEKCDKRCSKVPEVRLKTFVVLLLLLLVSSRWANAVAQERAPLVVSYSGINANYLSLWVGKEAGYFDQEGLDVQLLHVRGGSLVVQVLLSGQSPVAMVGATPIAYAYLKGARDLVMISGVTNVMAYVVASKPEIQGPADIKGKRVAVARFGSTSDFVAEYALKYWGLQRGEVKILQIGNEGDRLAAMQRGDIEVGVFTPTYVLAVKRLGMKVLLDLEELGVPYLLNGYATTRTFIRKDRPSIVGFMRGVLKGIRRVKQDRAFAEKMLSKYVRTQDPEVVRLALDEQMRTLPDFPVPSREGIRTILDDLARNFPDASRTSPDSLLDSSIVEEAARRP